MAKTGFGVYWIHLMIKDPVYVKHRSCGAAPLTKPAFHVPSRFPDYDNFCIRHKAHDSPQNGVGFSV